MMALSTLAGYVIDAYAILAFCFFMFSTIYSLPLRFRGVLPWHRLFRGELDHAINNTKDPEDLRQLKIAKKLSSISVYVIVISLVLIFVKVFIE